MRTSWLEPNNEHGAALHAFLDSILRDTADNRFLPAFMAFQSRVANAR